MHSYPGQQFARGLYAGMSERFKEPVLKTGAGKLAVGSNPTSGAIAPCEQLPSYLRAEFAITLPKPAALVFNGKHTSLPSWGCRFESGTLLHAVLLKERHLFGTILWQVLSLLYPGVLEQVDNWDLKSFGSDTVRVRFPSPGPIASIIGNDPFLSGIQACPPSGRPVKAGTNICWYSSVGRASDL